MGSAKLTATGFGHPQIFMMREAKRKKYKVTVLFFLLVSMP